MAKAEYELTGLELELRLAEIQHGQEPRLLARKKLEIRHRHGSITAEELEQGMHELEDFEDERKKLIAGIDLERKHGRITQDQYDRRRADIMGEPWVSMPRIHWNPMGKNRAYFEMDYNEHFVAQLRENGYEGEETEMVNQWMNDVCVSILEEINGMDAGLATPTRRGAALEE